MTTQKQALANQENAVKSTGPVTEEGKEIVSQNATKHGILSSKVVLTTESQEEYQMVRQRFIDDLKPQGAVEEVLVDRIVIYYWRLQRALVAEQGAIRRRLDNYSYKRILARAKQADEYDKYFALTSYRNERLQNSYSCERTIKILEEMAEFVEKEGFLPQPLEKKYINLTNLVFDEDSMGHFVFFNQIAQGKVSEEPKEKGKKSLLFIFNRDLELVKAAKTAAEEIEGNEDEAGEMMVQVPAAGDIDVLGRYEVSLERAFYRALNELTKIQVLRRGGSVYSARVVDMERMTGR